MRETTYSLHIILAPQKDPNLVGGARLTQMVHPQAQIDYGRIRDLIEKIAPRIDYDAYFVRGSRIPAAVIDEILIDNRVDAISLIR